MTAAKNENKKDILVKKIDDLLIEEGYSLKKCSEKELYDNQKNIRIILNDISYTKLRKINILINEVLNEKENKNSINLFEEFANVFTLLKKYRFETGYLEKILKNFSEEDYSESIVNVGKALESLSKSILITEEEQDTLGRLSYLLVIENVITMKEKLILEEIRECRNKNAHGEEFFTEISKEEAENYILMSFKIMKKMIFNK